VETVTHRLLPSLDLLDRELSRKAREFHDVIKIGRTHLQDAVPMRMGQEFGGYAQQVKNALARISAAMEGLHELPLGGTAVGTGLNAPAGFARETIAEIARITGCPFVEAKNHFEAQASKDAVVFLSGALKACAVTLTKIANDVRWMGSGPRCGIGELRLPALQPGSSIMPGKVNPVIAESLLMVCAQVIGYDATIAWCGAAGNFELNVMMPVMAYDLLESIRLLAEATRNFAHRLISGLEADRERALSFVEQSLAMGTALAPEIGYENAALLVKNAYVTARTVREVAVEQSGLSPERLNELLDPASQAG
jgi:fumarate hydratase class II